MVALVATPSRDLIKLRDAIRASWSVAERMTCPLQTVHHLSENQADWTQRKDGILMPRAKKHSAEEIVRSSAPNGAQDAKGRTAAEAAKKIGVTEQTYYRWRKEYGGLRTGPSQAAQGIRKGELSGAFS